VRRAGTQFYEYYFAIANETAVDVFFRACSYGESHNKYVLFDKQNQKGILLVDEDRESTGFTNDWDGGIDFWPVGSINDNKVYMPVSVMDFQKVIEEGKNNNISIKYPEKQKQLLNMVAGLDVSDNPILMVITLKKDE